MFGDRKSLQRFNNYHANYLTKAGFEIEPGIVGSTGSYGGVGYKEVKEIENQKLQYKISMMHNEYRKKHETQYNSFKKLSLKYEDIESEIKAYLKMSNKFNDAEINKLSTFLSLTQKMQYFDLTAQ
jgi:hypothetical protein